MAQGLPDRSQFEDRAAQTATLALVAPDGAPRMQRVWHAVVEGARYMAVEPTTIGAQHLRDDGRVCLLLDEDGHEDAITGLADELPPGQAEDLLEIHFAAIAPTARLLFEVISSPLLPPEVLEDPADRRLVVQALFSDLSPGVAQTMAHHLQYQSFAAGAVVVRQGAPADRFYIVVDGEVDVVQDRGGTRELLTTLGPGESFGESALLLKTPRSATVVARTPLRVLTLDKQAFEQVVLLSSEEDAPI